jgi:hypothetical protein
MAGWHRWALAGALITFGFLGAASIGLPFLLAGTLLAAYLAGVRADGGYGAAFGAAAVLFAIGVMWLFDSGFNPLLFFVPGAIVLAAGVAGCLRSHPRQRQL